MKLYGLKACDTCRKARQSLEKEGENVEFVDVRETPLGPDLIAEFLDEFGESLVNKRSTTWRELSDSARSLPPEQIITQNPTVMKRPVIRSETHLTLGWTAATGALHLGNTDQTA